VVTKKDKYLAAAQKFLERGQLDKALAEFAKVVQEDPKDTRTWLKMAELHAKRGAADQATEIYLKTGELYTEQGFFQKAVAVYKNVLKLSPGYIPGHFKLAEVFKKLGLVSDAIQQYELGAFAYQKAGKPADATGALRAIVELNPDNVVSRIKLAESASQAGMTEEAIHELGRAAEQLKAQGRQDEYVRVAERLLFHQPDNLAVARELAEVYIDRNNARLALAKLQTCLKVEPRAPENVSLLARAFEQLDVPKAVSVLKELAQIHHELGTFGDRDAAIRRALVLEPRDGELQELARRYGISASSASLPPPLPGSAAMRPLGQGQSGAYRGYTPTPNVGLRGAGASGEFGLGPGSRGTGAPSAQDTSRIMAESEVFVKYGLLDRAVDHLRRAFEIQPDFLPAREKLASVLTQLGRRAEAAAELEYMAEHLARTDHAQAMKLAERARVLDPDASRARALLDDAGGQFERGHSAVSELARLRAPGPPPRPLSPPRPRAAPAPAFDDADTDELTLGPDDLDLDLDLDLDMNVDVDVDPDLHLAAGVERRAGDDPALDLDTPPPRIAAAPIAPLRAGGAGDGDGDGHDGDGDGDGDGDLMAEIEQVEFFIEQSLFDDADAMLQDLRSRYPGHPVIEQKSAELERLAAAPTPPPARPPASFGSAGSSSSSLSSPGAMPRAYGSGSSGLPRSLDAEPDPVTPAPVAVVAGGEKADLTTHGDLGIAYKEMGLLDPAIAEFKLLTEDAEREVFALTMIGECCEAKGSLTDAIIRYKEALNCPQITPEETIQLYFCLGSTFERLNDRSEALYFYEKVAKRDPKFRDVGEKLVALKPRTARQA
jgi:tetratricopeptide (TPR) repeat protein